MATSTLPVSLAFNDIQLRIIDRNGKPWLTAADLARALGYSRSDNVTRVYERNKDEFTEDMSLTVKLTVRDAVAPKPVRIFSTRGCHLIAMLAKTPVAKQFRKWVLDVLEGLSAQPDNGLVAVQSEVIEKPMIPLESQHIGRAFVPAINAKLLHEYLEIGTRYSDWFARRVRHFGFVADQDFVLNRELIRHNTGTVRTTSHYVTLEVAERLAGYECSERGRLALEYVKGILQGREVNHSNPVNPLDVLATSFRGRILLSVEGGRISQAQVVDGESCVFRVADLPSLVSDPGTVERSTVTKIMEAALKRLS